MSLKSYWLANTERNAHWVLTKLSFSFKSHSVLVAHVWDGGVVQPARNACEAWQVYHGHIDMRPRVPKRNWKGEGYEFLAYSGHCKPNELTCNECRILWQNVPYVRNK